MSEEQEMNETGQDGKRLGWMGGARWGLTEVICRPFRIAFTVTFTVKQLGQQ